MGKWCHWDGKVFCFDWKSGVIGMESVLLRMEKSCDYDANMSCSKWKSARLRWIKRNLYAYDFDTLSMERQARREANHIRAKKSVNNFGQKI